MKVSAVTTCVRYAPHLARGAEVWCSTLDEWLVVTTATDLETLEVCKRFGIRTLCTDAFTRDQRAYFDKAAAIDEGLAALAPADWVLLVDADVQAPADWRRVLDKCEPGHLYGARRGRGNPHIAPGRASWEPERRGRCELGGYFHLWHVSDPAWAADPKLGSWVSAGAYDSKHEQRWPREKRLRLPLQLVHSGQQDRDWCGAGNAAGMRAMLKARQDRGGSWIEERLDRTG